MFFSCNNNRNNQRIEKTVYNATTWVEDFNISTCIYECKYDSGGIISKNVKNDTMYLKIGHWLNCSYEKAFLKNSIISKTKTYFMIDIPHETEIDESGDEIELYSMAACNCYFTIDFKIVGLELVDLKDISSEILINGKKLENYRGEKIK